jgi:hypothetical protein
LVDDLLDKGVIPCELNKICVSQAIEAGISDMSKNQPLRTQASHYQSGAHTRATRRCLGRFPDNPIRGSHGLLRPPSSLLPVRRSRASVAEILADCLDRQTACHLSGAGAADTVGDDHQPVVRVDTERILVTGAHLTPVGSPGKLQSMCRYAGASQDFGLDV